MDNLAYNQVLLKLLDDDKDRYLFNDNLLVNIYVTLLSLNNHYYSKDIYIKELDIVEDFLRKINNLKVKIQLKRKEEEIELLLSNIVEIYNDNKRLIDEYNKDSVDVLEEVATKNPVNLTNLIDNFTKEKMHRLNLINELSGEIEEITYVFPFNKYDIDKDTLVIHKDNLRIKLDEFYTLFSYLLNSNNFRYKYTNEEINESYKKMIDDLISLVIERKLPEGNIIIPIMLTYLLSQDTDYTKMDTSKFNILNIKITDLYSFAKKEGNLKEAKWKNISIPSEYLYNKIKEISGKGMYYFLNDNFIIENTPTHRSDFKISITVADMKEFLKQNIINLKDQSN